MSPTLNGVNRSKVLQMKWPPGLERKHQEQSVVLVQELGKVIAGSKYYQVRDSEPASIKSQRQLKGGTELWRGLGGFYSTFFPKFFIQLPVTCRKNFFFNFQANS